MLDAADRTWLLHRLDEIERKQNKLPTRRQALLAAVLAYGLFAILAFLGLMVVF